MGKLINIDNGGTLTDFCAFDGERLLFTKALTTPHDLSTCFFDGLNRLSELTYGEQDVARLLQETDYIRYSTTQGTNALVERRGPRLGLITSSEQARGELTRGEQEELLDAIVGERFRSIDLSLDDAELDTALTRSINELGALGANRIVVSLDDDNPETAERRFERIVLRRYPSHLLGALPITFAADMSRDSDYSRRTWTALFNAFLHPAMERFLYGAEHRLKLHRTRNPLLIFRNDGGSARVAKTIALKTYSSGPRGGMEGARELARHYKLDKLLSIDVGGTTTDVGIVAFGELQQDHYGTVEDIQVSAPLCRIHSEGVGGSSVIRAVDGAIEVGPHSVGAAPGPACFARGGTDATITDVLLLNGMIDPATYFGGELALDAERARSALLQAVAEPLGIDADEVLVSVEASWVAKIVEGIRHLTDVDSDTMLAGFGGGGPMLLTAVADALGVAQAIIPGMAPVFSAYGIGFSDLSQHYQTQVSQPTAAALQDARDELLKRATRDMFAEGTAIADCELSFTIVSLDDESVLGWSEQDTPPPGLNAPVLLRLEASKPIERLSFRSDATGDSKPATSSATRRITHRGEAGDVPLFRFCDLQPGDTAAGPCIIEDDYFTARIDTGWQFRMSGNRDLLLRRGND